MIILVTGGQRSGKSLFAEQLALKLSPHPVYLATARVEDDEMRRRVELHRSRRAHIWDNIEEPVNPSRHPLDGRTVLLDCVTLWATNLFFDSGDDPSRAYDRLVSQFERLTSTPGINLILVTNEIGLGGTSANAMQRQFTDLQGRVNQLIASRADDVYFMISGIPMKIKPQ